MMHCPDPETIARYLEATLDDEARREVERHAVTCDRCYVTLRESARYHRASGAAERRAPTLRYAAGLAAAVILLALTASGAWLALTADDSRRQLAEALEEARLPYRTTYGRTSLVEAPWAPWQGPERGLDGSLPSSGFYRILRTTSEIHSREPDGGPETEALRGLAHLVEGEGAYAVAALDRARIAGEPSADLRADLAAAYLQVSVEDGDREAAQEALAWAVQALEVEPRHPAAGFNRALALEALGLPGQAIRAWDDYLRMDAESPWAEEGVGYRMGDGT